MLRRLLSLTMVLFLVSFVFAGTTGKIAGIIVDKNTGDPLPGVNVVIEELSIGASSDVNGEYFILNVPVGEHKVTVSYIGYKTIEYEGAQVQADRTLGVNFELEEAVMDIGEVIVVEAERERVKKDLTMSSQFVDKEEFAVLPIESFEQASQLQAGAVGSNFRGGRASEAAPVVDGMNIKDATAGYTDITDEENIQTNLVLPEVAIEQMEVITGGFNAEYGNAQSAVINVITKEGGTKHTGRITVKTSGLNHNTKRYLFKNQDGEYVYYRDQFLKEFFDNAKPSDSLYALGARGPYMVDDLYLKNTSTIELDNYDRQEVEFSLSGPIPFTSDKLRYSISGEFVDNNQFKTSYSGDGITGSAHAKLTYRFSPDYKLQFVGVGSQIDGRAIGFADSKYPGGYIPGYGIIPAKVNTEEYTFYRNYMGSLKWTHTLSSSTFYEINAGYSYNSFEQKTKDWNDRDGDGDFDEFFEWKMVPVPVTMGDQGTEWTEDLRYTSDDTKFFWVPAHAASGSEGQYRWGVPGVSGWREVWVLDKTNYTYRKEWRFLTGTQNERELTSYTIAEETEGQLYPTVPDAYFDYYGDGASYYDAENKIFNLKADFTSQINPQHLVKAGIDFTRTELDMLNVNAFSGSSNLYIDDFYVKPWDFAAYVQDKMEFEGMIVNLGVRLDYYNQGSDIEYPSNFTDPVDLTKEVGEEGYINNPKKAKPYYKISPRLGISHPITENSVLHFSYGHFYQRPDYRYWYENTPYDLRGAYSEMGNPDLKPEQTISYEIGLQQNLGEYLIGVNAFYKDISNLIDQIEAGTAPFEDYWLYDNRDWANARGFEISIRKFFSNYFAGNINYTYMIAKGKASSPQSGGAELWRKTTGVQQAYFLNWDQRHTFNANITFSFHPEWGPEIAGYHPLGDWSLNILYTYGSPKPYTPPSRDPQPPYNTERLESNMSTDIKLEKRFAISGDIRAVLFIEGYNIFNRQNLIAENFRDQTFLTTNVNRIEWYHINGDPEGRNLEPFVWGSRRHFRFGLGFQF